MYLATKPPKRRTVGVTPTSAAASVGSKRCSKALKWGSYCLTALPLLLRTVLPLAIQRSGGLRAVLAGCSQKIMRSDADREAKDAIDLVKEGARLDDETIRLWKLASAVDSQE
jgi:hypothetical protein